jgi:hypothetical protein
MRIGPRTRLIIAIVIIVVLIAEVLSGYFLVSVVQDIQIPQVTIRMNVDFLMATGVALNISLNITNSNSFDINLSNIEVSAVNQNGTTLLTLNLSAFSISAHTQRILIQHKVIGLQAPLTDTIFATLSGTVTARFFGLITKQLPVTIHFITSGLDVINTITGPTINIDAHLHTLTKTGVTLSGVIAITNDNDIDITVENISASVQNPQGQQIGSINNISGGVVAEHHTLGFVFTGMLEYKVFDIQEIHILFQATVGGKIAGFSKTLPISAQLTLPIPSLQDLLNSTVPIEISLYGAFKVHLNGVLVNITFSITNPYILDLYTNDLVVKVWRVDHNTSHLLGSVPLNPCQASTNETGCSQGDLTIPYRNLLFAGTLHLLPTYYELDLNGNFSLAGINQKLPLSFNAFLSPHLLRKPPTTP